MAVFDPDSEAIDFIVLAGQQSPGLAVVAGGSSPRKWDEQQGYGTDGASLKWTGDGLAEFDVKLFLWLPSHFTAWESFKQLVKKTVPGVQPKAMVIQNPFLDDLDISQVVVTDRTQLTLDDETGMWAVTIKFKQYRKPKPALAAPKGAIDGPDSQDDAKDKYDKLIDQIDAQNKKLAEQDATL